MPQTKMDMAKVLAILSQPKEALPPLENVQRIRMEVPYITKAGKVEARWIRAILPGGAVQPMPLIYVPHYEMGEDAVELRDYLSHGWAVACPDSFDNSYNGMLTDDDLVFNNAALHALRKRPEFDLNKIILVGGSAGGYMTLMLNGLQLGLCASIANGPVTNVYFNFHFYWNRTNVMNMQALARLAAENTADEHANADSKDPLKVMQRLSSLPVPFMAGLAGMFAPIRDNFPNAEDFSRWESLSPVGLADCFCSPFMVNHCTSDVLVPVDQISKRFTYDQPGESLPEGFLHRLPESFPGKLGKSLEECLPESATRTACIHVPEKAPDVDLPYDADKRFNLNIFDDGPVEGYGSHSSRVDVGRRLDCKYLQEMFSRTARNTCVLTPGMLKSLLLRWQGKSVALPAHIGVNDTVYGSLAVYRQEILEELSLWEKNHGEGALNSVMEILLPHESDIAELKKAYSEIRQMLKNV